MLVTLERRAPGARTPAATSAHSMQRLGCESRLVGTKHIAHHASPQSSHLPTARAAKCFAHACMVVAGCSACMVPPFVVGISVRHSRTYSVGREEPGLDP